VTCDRPGIDAAKCHTLTRDWCALLGICHVSLRFTTIQYVLLGFTRQSQGLHAVDKPEVNAAALTDQIDA
jgi:hypothetical protein